MYTIYNIIARINCFVLPFLFLFFSTTFSQHFAQHRHHTITSPSKVEPLAALPSMSKQNLSDVHPAFCQSQKIHAARILKSTALDSSLFPNAASRLISSDNDRFQDIFIYIIPKTIPKRPSTSVAIYICDCFVKPLISFFCVSV